MLNRGKKVANLWPRVNRFFRCSNLGLLTNRKGKSGHKAREKSTNAGKLKGSWCPGKASKKRGSQLQKKKKERRKKIAKRG